MNNEKNQIIGIDLDLLEAKIQQAVKTQMEQLIENHRFGSEWKDEILTRKKAAELFGKSPEKISEMYERREIPGFKTGREYFFLKSQLTKLFKLRK